MALIRSSWRWLVGVAVVGAFTGTALALHDAEAEEAAAFGCTCTIGDDGTGYDCFGTGKCVSGNWSCHVKCGPD